MTVSFDYFADFELDRSTSSSFKKGDNSQLVASLVVRHAEGWNSDSDAGHTDWTSLDRWTATVNVPLNAKNNGIAVRPQNGNHTGDGLRLASASTKRTCSVNTHPLDASFGLIQVASAMYSRQV